MNIALISDVPPDANYTAGQVLFKIIENTNFATFKFIWLNQSSLPDTNSFPSNCNLQSNISLQSGAAMRALRRTAFQLCARVPKLRGGVNSFFAVLPAIIVGIKLGVLLRMSRVDLIWLTLQGEKLAVAYTLIAAISGKKVILHQWDPISWWMENRKHPKQIISIAEGIVDRLEKRAVINLVPSETWQKMLTHQNKAALRIDNFFSEGDLPEGAIPIRVGSPSEVNAVFVGQFYSNMELMQLLRVLQNEAKRLGKTVILHYFGSGHVDTLVNGIKVVSYGHISRNDLIKRIAKWDVALLPYPTEARFSDTSRLSFPSKSRVYLAAGLPILSYCNEDSSPKLFFATHYAQYFNNAKEGLGLPEFLLKITDASIGAWATRFSASRQLIEKTFSEDAELKPLHNFLETLR